MKIIFLDIMTLGDVSNLHLLEALGEVTYYQNTTDCTQTLERLKSADIVITNKVQITKEIIDHCPDLKLICIAATGTNNVDLEAAKQRNIPVKNAENYSTDSVVQHTFTLLFDIVSNLQESTEAVRSGRYYREGLFTYLGTGFTEISGKTMGIIGLGNIGRKVADVASTFGMNVVYYSTTDQDRSHKYERVDFSTLLKISDVVSIHAPLNEKTKYLIGYEALSKMKASAILLNLGRGGIIDETALTRALQENQIMAAAIDVMEQEPLPAENPLLDNSIKDKLVITPHIAWASKESRERLVEIIANNIYTFIRG